MTKQEWKTQALGYILRAKEWADSPYRQEREYASYLKRFFFGDGEITFNGKNDTWKMRAERLDLPMPANIYLYG